MRPADSNPEELA